MVTESPHRHNIINIWLFFAAIEESYSGPALEDGKVTVKFMEDLMETFKSEKKLHKRYAYQVIICSCNAWTESSVYNAIL